MDLWDLALGFMDAQVLLTAEELGVFNRLDAGPRSASEIATHADLPEDSAVRLLTALCALGVVRRTDDGAYVNGPEAAAQLVAGKPGYIGGMFRHAREDLYPVWRYFKEALREGQAQWGREAAATGGRPRNEQMHEDPAALRSFLEGMHAITYRAGRDLVAMAPELARVRTMTDVGGAAGSFLIALAEGLPELRGLVFDLPGVGPVAEDFIRRFGLADRLAFRAGDFWDDPLPEGQDAYALGFILHDWDDLGGSILLEKVAAASRPGALLVVGEFLLDDDRTGPRHVARSDLNMLVAARGRERTAGEYRDWLDRSGFTVRQIYLTSVGKAFLIAERR